MKRSMFSRSGLLVAALVLVIAAVGLWAGSAWLQPSPGERLAALQRKTTATVLPRDYARLPDIGVRTASGQSLRQALADYARLPDIGVRTASGQSLRQALAGDWSLLFLGFTHCPDVCPITMQVLAATAGRMDGDTMPRVAFVSVDPRRDSADTAARYAAEFNPDFIGATGDVAALRELADTLRVDFDVPEEPADAQYDVAHPSAVFLLDPRGRLRAVFSTPHEPATMAADLRRIIQTYGSPS